MSTQTISVPDWPLHYRLALAVDRAGIDARDLADELGLSPAAVYGYLRGDHRPKRPTLAMIAAITNVPVWWLEGQDAPPDGEPVTYAVTLRDQKHRRPHTLRVISHTGGTGPPVTDEHLMDVA